MANTNDDWTDLIKRFPRRNLDTYASQRILNQLRQTAATKSRRSKRNGRVRRTVISLAVVALLFAIPVLPALSNQAEQLLGRMLPSTGSPQEWSVSPKFDLRDRDGRVIYPDRLRGIEGKIGFTENFDFVAKSKETVSKMFWYVWDDSLPSGTRLEAKAVNLETGKRFILNETTLQGPIYGADTHALTNFTPFPEKGLWRIDVKMNGDPFARFVVPVKDEYIHTATSKFLVSRDDVAIGDTAAILVVPGNSGEDTLEVRVSSLQNEGLTRIIPFRRGAEYLESSTMKPITHYNGTLHFDSPGDWRIEVLGETTTVSVK